MNLLMITGDRSLASGLKGALYSTLEELHTHFDRIDVICPRGSSSRYDMSVFGNVYIHPSPWPIVAQPLWIMREGARLIQTHRPSVVTVHEYAPFYNGIGARMLMRNFSIPYVMEIMHIPGHPRSAGIRERFYRWLTRMYIARDVRLSRAVRVINATQTPDFLATAGVPRSKMVHIPAFYIDLATFKPSDIEKKYDIAFVARLAMNKGVDTFLDVVERTGLVGVCVGDGPLLPWARAESKRRGLKIHFPGFARDAQEVAQYINESRIMLMPSLNEGGPRVVLEAMACGVPVVATPVGIVADVLPPECIEDWNAGDIADKIKNILGDPMLYERLRAHGIMTATRFERADAIRVYAEKLKEIANG